MLETSILTTSSVVVEMSLDITADDPSQCPDQVVHLSRVRTSHRIRNADSVDADLVDGLVDREQIDEIGPEGVLRREADLDAFALRASGLWVPRDAP